MSTNERDDVVDNHAQPTVAPGGSRKARWSCWCSPWQRLCWELRWQAPEAESFSVELFNEAEESRGVLIEDSEDSESSTFVSEAGSFYLEVSSDSDWSLSVIGPPPE